MCGCRLILFPADEHLFSLKSEPIAPDLLRGKPSVQKFCSIFFPADLFKRRLYGIFQSFFLRRRSYFKFDYDRISAEGSGGAA